MPISHFSYRTILPILLFFSVQIVHAQSATDSLGSYFFAEGRFGFSPDFRISYESSPLPGQYNNFEKVYTMGYSWRLHKHLHLKFGFNNHFYTAEQSLADSSFLPASGTVLYLEKHYRLKTLHLETGLGFPFSPGQSRLILQPQFYFSYVRAIGLTVDDLLGDYVNTVSIWNEENYSKSGGMASAGCAATWLFSPHFCAWFSLDMSYMILEIKEKDLSYHPLGDWYFKGSFFSSALGIAVIFPPKK